MNSTHQRFIHKVTETEEDDGIPFEEKIMYLLQNTSAVYGRRLEIK